MFAIAAALEARMKSGILLVGCLFLSDTIFR